MAREYEHIQHCRSCGAAIVFLRTRKGKLMPVDAETVDHDEYQFQHGKHRAHFATCPEADRHRKG